MSHNCAEGASCSAIQVFYRLVLVCPLVRLTDLGGFYGVEHAGFSELVGEVWDNPLALRVREKAPDPSARSGILTGSTLGSNVSAVKHKKPFWI